MLENFKNPKELAYKIGTNIVVNGVDIYKEMNAAYTNYQTKNYEAFGKDIGVSLALVFIGASNAAKLNPAEAKVMESMAEGQLYSEITGQVFHDSDNSAYVDFLERIANEEDPTVLPNYNLNLLNLQQVQPVQVLNQQQYVQLLNLLSNQQQMGYLY